MKKSTKVIIGFIIGGVTCICLILFCIAAILVMSKLKNKVENQFSDNIFIGFDYGAKGDVYSEIVNVTVYTDGEVEIMYDGEIIDMLYIDDSDALFQKINRKKIMKQKINDDDIVCDGVIYSIYLYDKNNELLDEKYVYYGINHNLDKAYDSLIDAVGRQYLDDMVDLVTENQLLYDEDYDDEINENIEDTYSYDISAEELFDQLFDEYRDGLTSDEVEILINGMIEVDDSPLFGTWNRTNVSNGEYAELTFEQLDFESFSINGQLTSYAAASDIEQETGFFICEEKAISISGDIYDEDSVAVLLIEINHNSLEIRQIGYYGYLGGSVIADGLYIMGEPKYSNDGIYEETFDAYTRKNIISILKNNGIDYDYYFLTPTSYGVLEIEEDVVVFFPDGYIVSGTWYNGWVPHDGLCGYDLFISEDGEIYYQNYNEEFASTDNSYNEMPIK